MDHGDTLNAPRPAWVGSVSQSGGNWSSSTSDEQWVAAPGPDASRPAWEESANEAQVPPSRRDYLISAANKPLVDHGEPVANNARSHQGSRPVDFLKIVGLWAAANRGDETGEEFRAEGPTSMAAAKKLGGGYSFSVSLVGVDDRTYRRLQLRSPFVAYKRLKRLTDDLDVVDRGKLLHAVLLEVRVLTHQPLRTHSNIARLLQLIWEPDPDDPDQAWPVLVLEYAEHGCLADFQLDYPKLPFSLKKKLCWDVGYGLSALHSAGVVHGDLKPKNVLICDTDDRNKVVAKLADFGCAVADLEPSDTLKLPGWSPPWNAPESRDRLPRDLLQCTDIYSYGLVIWSVVLDGADPFRHISALAPLDDAEFLRQADILKIQDRVLPLAKSTLRSPFCGPEESCLVASVLNSTLQLDASKRNLNRSLGLLREPSWPDPSFIEPLVRYEYQNIEVSVLTDAVAPMCLQLSIIRELEKLSTKHARSGSVACLNLFELYIERLEWRGANRSAAKWYLRAVKRDPTAGLARYAFGVFELLQLPVPPEIDPVSTLESLARNGCYHSLMELRRRSPPRFPELRQEYRRHGGLLRREEKHEIFDMCLFDDFGGYFSHLLAKEENMGSKLGKMLVSRNGDVLLHAAARYGCTRAIDHLLSLGVNVDITNRDGETALFQACRAGSLEAAKLLLDKGANPAMAATNGETPLHWVFAFDEDGIERATHILITNGGEANLHVTVAAGDSSAVEYLALHGTPLHYAILARNKAAARSLLFAGADPFIGYGYETMGGASPLTPFRLAVRELLPSIIKIMIDSPIFGSRLGGYLASMTDSILHFAVESSSKAIRRVSLGATYASVVIETIDLLRTIEGKEKALEFGMSLLHACIVHGLPAEVIEHLLENGCREDLELISSRYGHTPLQVAMHLDRKNTFLLLLKYGANTQRRLRFPDGLSYVQFCAHLGPRALFYAETLVACGPVSHKVDCPNLSDDPKSLSQFDPPLFAFAIGNYNLAAFLAKAGGSKHIVKPSTDVFSLLFRFFPSLPVSRLEHLLNPPEGIEPRALKGYSDLGRTCFHSMLNHPFRGEGALREGFQYLLAKSEKELLNQPDSFGNPPLNTAITLGHLDVVVEMLAAGADPNLGNITSVNWAYLCLKRLQKAPSQFYTPWGGLPLSRRDARSLQDDFKSMILLLKQHGGREVRMSNGMIEFPFYQFALNCLKTDYSVAKSSYRKGREYGTELMAQHGLREGLKHIWKHEATQRVITGAEGPSGTLNMLKSSVQRSHMRYQEDLAKRSRFSAAGAAGSQLSEAGTLGNQLGGITSRVKSMTNFARWYFLPPATEIEKPDPLTSRLQSQHQGTYQQPAPYSPFSANPRHTTVPYPAPNSQLEHRFAPGVVSSLYPEPQHPVSVQNPVQTQSSSPRHQAHSLPEQLTSPQTPEFHIRLLSQQLTPVLFSPTTSLSELHNRVQQCLDAHFAQAGAAALFQGAGPTPAAPLCSLSVLELENGLKRLLQGRLEVIVVRRDEMLKAIVYYPGEDGSDRPERVRTFLNSGWMGWRELEEKEAEILTRFFEESMDF